MDPSHPFVLIVLIILHNSLLARVKNPGKNFVCATRVLEISVKLRLFGNLADLDDDDFNVLRDLPALPCQAFVQQLPRCYFGNQVLTENKRRTRMIVRSVVCVFFDWIRTSLT